jgi:pimeloyl-ACP methyl ester carboxylesterase
MKKLLLVLAIVLLRPAALAAAVATLTFTSATDQGTYPATVKCDQKTIAADLSALGRQARIVRAVLRPAGDIAGRVRSHEYKTPPPVIVTAGAEGKPLALLPPRYVSFDATAAVTEGLAAGQDKIVFNVVSLPGFSGSAVLEVTCTGEAKTKARIPRVTGIRAEHRAGQTFVTFREPDPPVNDTITARAFKELAAKLAKERPRTTFRVYRHTQPITAASIHEARLVDEVGRLTCWNPEQSGHDPADAWKVVRLAVEPEKPLPPEAGLCVLHPAAPGKAWYAVSVAVDGEEDLSVFDAGNAAASPLEETVGLGEPVLQKVMKVGKGGQLDHFCYVREATLYFYTRWEAPPDGNRSDNPLDYIVAVPPKLANPAGVDLHLHGWGGNMFGSGFWTNALKGWLCVTTNQVPYDWWTGYHECSGTWRSWADGTVHDYTQTRLMSFLDWADGKWKIDRARISVQGGSMGGSGTTNLALRRADRIAFAAGSVGVHVPGNSPQFTSSYIHSYGPLEWRLPFMDGKTAAFDYFNNVWYLKHHAAASMPLVVFSNGKNDGGIGWPQALEFFRAMQETRQPHVFFWGLSGHGQGLKLPGEPADKGDYRVFGMDVRSDRTLPAFTRCSLDEQPGTATPRPKAEYERDRAAAQREKEEKKLQYPRPVDPYDGDSIGQANAYFTWETDDAQIVDEPRRWGLTLGLISAAPKDACTVDVTPRRCQKFTARPGERLKWSNMSLAGNRLAGSGTITVDALGLATLPQVTVTKGKNRLSLERN